MKATALSKEKSQRERGQSLVELTLFVPIMILLLAGFVEIGFLINGYITALDASRASARYVSPLDPKVTRCQPFGPDADPTNSWISFTPDCTTGIAEYPSRAAFHRIATSPEVQAIGVHREAGLAGQLLILTVAQPLV